MGEESLDPSRNSEGPEKTKQTDAKGKSATNAGGGEGTPGDATVPGGRDCGSFERAWRRGICAVGGRREKEGKLGGQRAVAGRAPFLKRKQPAQQAQRAQARPELLMPRMKAGEPTRNVAAVKVVVGSEQAAESRFFVETNKQDDGK